MATLEETLVHLINGGSIQMGGCYTYKIKDGAIKYFNPDTDQWEPTGNYIHNLYDATLLTDVEEG